MSGYWRCPTCETAVARWRLLCWRCATSRPKAADWMERPDRAESPDHAGLAAGVLILVAALVTVVAHLTILSCLSGIGGAGCSYRGTGQAVGFLATVTVIGGLCLGWAVRLVFGIRTWRPLLASAAVSFAIGVAVLLWSSPWN